MVCEIDLPKFPKLVTKESNFFFQKDFFFFSNKKLLEGLIESKFVLPFNYSVKYTHTYGT